MRSSINQECLSSLATMSIENERANSMYFDTLIDLFA